MQQIEQCLITGSGPAGYTAAIYASRANLQPLLLQGPQPGGQLTITTEVENFPGYKNGVSGAALMEDLKDQALRFGARIEPAIAVEADLKPEVKKIITDSGKTLFARSVIIATGATAKFLGLPDETRYAGMGVSACATCDGFFYRKKRVAVVGGGDTACEEALYLSGLASYVYMVVRKPFLRASQVMRHRVEQRSNIEILFNSNVTGLYGEDGVEGAHIVKFQGEANEATYDLPVDGLFLAIGHTPNTGLFKGQLALDENGYIITQGVSQLTSLPGVFAAGDVADPHYRQAVVAAASGCRAALDAEKYLLSLGD